MLLFSVTKLWNLLAAVLGNSRDLSRYSLEKMQVSSQHMKRGSPPIVSKETPSKPLLGPKDGVARWGFLPPSQKT